MRDANDTRRRSGCRRSRRRRRRRRRELRRARREDVAVDALVVVDHAHVAEPRLEDAPAGCTIDRVDPAHRLDHRCLVVADEARYPVLHHLGNRAAPARDHRRAAGERFDHHQSERLRPVNREEQRARASQKPRLVVAADLPQELDVTAEQRANRFLAVRAVDGVDLRSDLERQAGRRGDANRRIDAFLRRDAAEKREVASVAASHREARDRQAVMNGRVPVGGRQRPALRVADRDERRARIRGEHDRQVGHVEPPVQRRHDRRVRQRRQRQPDVVHVIVDDVEAPRERGDALDLRDVVRQGVDHDGIEAQRARSPRDETRPRDGIAAREERDLVAATEELFRQIADDAFGAAVEMGRNAFVQRSYLGEAHS